MNKPYSKTRTLVECALMIALATVLGFIPLYELPHGGSITLVSMLPVLLVSYRHGTRWGVFTAFVHSLIQLLLGLSNVSYAPDALTAVGIILLDYVIAFTLIGFAACFNNLVKNRRLSIVLGIVVTFLGRFVCHFLSGVLIWEALWPNELGWASSVWSLAYNGSYMIPEIIITAIVAWLSYAPLKKYWHGEDLPKAR